MGGLERLGRLVAGLADTPFEIKCSFSRNYAEIALMHGYTVIKGSGKSLEEALDALVRNCRHAQESEVNRQRVMGEMFRFFFSQPTDPAAYDMPDRTMEGANV